jgi:hypothetical protein
MTLISSFIKILSLVKMLLRGADKHFEGHTDTNGHHERIFLLSLRKKEDNFQLSIKILVHIRT